MSFTTLIVVCIICGLYHLHLTTNTVQLYAKELHLCGLLLRPEQM